MKISKEILKFNSTTIQKITKKPTSDFEFLYRYRKIFRDFHSTDNKQSDDADRKFLNLSTTLFIKGQSCEVLHCVIQKLVNDKRLSYLPSQY